MWIDMAQLVHDRSLARRACSSRGAGQEGGVGGLELNKWWADVAHHILVLISLTLQMPPGLCVSRFGNEKSSRSNL